MITVLREIGIWVASIRFTKKWAKTEVQLVQYLNESGSRGRFHKLSPTIEKFFRGVGRALRSGPNFDRAISMICAQLLWNRPQVVRISDLPVLCCVSLNIRENVKTLPRRYVLHRRDGAAIPRLRDSSARRQHRSFSTTTWNIKARFLS